MMSKGSFYYVQIGSKIRYNLEEGQVAYLRCTKKMTKLFNMQKILEGIIDILVIKKLV